MSFLVWCEIVCHNCAGTTCGEYTRSGIDRRGMKRDAISAGWIFNKKGETYCSQGCVDEWARIEREAAAPEVGS